jgi:hypothetical protein
MKKIAALQMLVNTINPIILSTAFGRRIALHQSNSRWWFSSTKRAAELMRLSYQEGTVCVSYLSFFA